MNEIYQLGKKIHELDFSDKFPFHQRAEIDETTRKPKENILLVAKTEGKVVGFLYSKILFTRAGGWCMLDNLAVDRDYRGEGISDMLLKQLYKILKKEKVNYVQILEEAHHKNTRAFWKHEGYKETKLFVWAERTIK